MATQTITLTRRETEQFEDSGPVGDAYRAQIRRQYQYTRTEIIADDGYVLDVLAPDIAATVDACDWYRYPDGGYVAVLTGMPSEHVWIGLGDSQSAAVAALERTPVQCTGADSGTAQALQWAVAACMLDCDIDELVEVV